MFWCYLKRYQTTECIILVMDLCEIVLESAGNIGRDFKILQKKVLRV